MDGWRWWWTGHGHGHGHGVTMKTVQCCYVNLLELHVVLLLFLLLAVPLAEGTEGSAGEQDDALLLAVVEEVVEGPETAVLTKRIGRQVRVVTVDVAFGQVDLIVQRSPQVVMHLGVAIGGRHRQQTVNIGCHILQ